MTKFVTLNVAILYMGLLCANCNGKGVRPKNVKESEFNLASKVEKVARTFIVEYDGDSSYLIALLKKKGYQFSKRIAGNFYKFVDKTSPSTKNKLETRNEEKTLRKLDKHIKSFQQDEFVVREKKSQAPTSRTRYESPHRKWHDVLHRKRRNVPGRQKRYSVEDSYWQEQWHLHDSHSPSMNVIPAWDLGYSGSGVTVAIVDDGIEHSHQDLRDNFDLSNSYDFLDDVQDPSHKAYGDGHGTNCAGIVGAVENTDCVIGIAFRAKLPGIRLLGIGVTNSDEADALTFNKANIAIYSNSWGPTDTGYTIDPLPSLQEAALLEGVTQGRGGLGNIYTWAGGNGRNDGDDCSADGYVGSPYTIAVASLGPHSSPAFYSEACPGIMCATYGGDSRYDSIATTEVGGSCTDDFQGTSAATPVASGILALVLEANGNLTWRDVQHMIVEYSTRNGMDSSNDFYTNGARKSVSLNAGFGLLNAHGMVSAAPYWSTVPNQLSCDTPLSPQSSMSHTSEITDSIVVNSCQIRYLEHVVVYVKYQATVRGQVRLFLQSANGTQETRLFNIRGSDASTALTVNKILSVHQWGEDPAGTWTLRLDNTGFGQFTLYEWKLTLYGTGTDPLLGKPSDGAPGGHCDISVNDVCTGNGFGCFQNICIFCSNYGFTKIGEVCIQDGTVSGVCNDTVLCKSRDIGCNNMTNRCILCEADYHGVSGFCMQDEFVGGLCGTDGYCNGTNAGCNSTTNVCVECGTGHRLHGAYCKQDGALGGFCQNGDDCLEQDNACHINTNTCMICNNGFHNFSGLCIQDGRLDGYCDLFTQCLDSGTACNGTVGQCKTCANIRSGYCFASDCGGVYTGSSGSLTSPNFPQQYPHNSVCQYVIVLHSGSVSLTFHTLSLTDDTTCSKDYIEVYDGGSATAPLIDTYCQNYTLPIQSSGTQMFLQFVSDATESGDGFNAIYTSTDPTACGGLFSATSGTFSSPNYPSFYPNDANCTWTIAAGPGSWIFLSFDAMFDIESPCQYDVLVVYNSSVPNSNAEIGRYCGSTAPSALVSRTGYMTLRFTSDNSITKTGFQVSYTTVGRESACGGVFEDVSGSITTPDYPASFNDSTACHFYIASPLNRAISLRLQYFAIQPLSSCLTVQNGFLNDSPELGKICGSLVLPTQFISTSDVIHVTISPGQQTVFNATYEPDTLTCGETMTSSSGVIESPGYPLAYPVYAHCTWHIRLNTDAVIYMSLDVTEFQLEESTDCSKDYVAIYNGNIKDESILMKRMCGNISSALELRTTTHEALVELVSYQAGTGKGFRLSYTKGSAICNQVLAPFTSDEITLSNYGNNERCTWVVQQVFAYVISLNFTSLNIEAGPGCPRDYVEVFDGTLDDASLGKFCGSTIPSELRSTSNLMTIRFQSDLSTTDVGFIANVSPVTDSETLYAVTGTNGSVSSSGYPGNYPDHVRDRWLIQVSEGKSVRLVFVNFALQNGDGTLGRRRRRRAASSGGDCLYDQVLVFEGDSSDASALLGRYCGSDLPPALQTKGNVMSVRFISDGNVTGTGFNATYDEETIVASGDGDSGESISNVVIIVVPVVVGLVLVGVTLVVIVKLKIMTKVGPFPDPKENLSNTHTSDPISDGPSRTAYQSETSHIASPSVNDTSRRLPPIVNSQVLRKPST